MPGGEFIQDFHKGEIYLIKENFVGKKFSLENIFCHLANFSSDIINIFDLVLECSKGPI